MARIFVAIATVGRADLVRRTVDHLATQSRRPDGVVVVGAAPGDVDGLDGAALPCEPVIARRGLCAQRNAALDILAGRADIVTFFDDDFVAAPDYLEQVERLLGDLPDVVGITGELVADGACNAGYAFDAALALVRQGAAAMDPAIRPRQALYGCNMSIRLAAADGLRFDEALPLYGWQEDIDYTYQLGRRGRLISTGLVTGVHMGVKAGRTSGKRLGYSQVANLVYLWRKGTMQPKLGERLLRQNLMSNLARSLWPEPHIDRRGRLAGNALALADWLRGRIDPRRIETM